MPEAIVGESDPDALERAAARLLLDQAIVLPTDTVYGLAARPTAAGLDQLFALKDRPKDRSVALLVSDAAQVQELAASSERDRQLMNAFWPGPLTLVLARHASDVAFGAADGTVGVRCPSRDFVRDLARRVGPLAVTSANRSGRVTPTDATEAAADLVGNPALVVDGGPCSGRASTVLRCHLETVEVFRLGDITEEMVLHALANANGGPCQD